MNSTSFPVLSFEPNPQLAIPYMYFPHSYHFTFQHVLTKNSLKKLAFTPQLITLSASFPPEQIVDFLWQLKNFSNSQIVPLIFVVDWSQPLTQIPGTTWGGKVGLLHSLSDQSEVAATLDRLMNATSL